MNNPMIERLIEALAFGGNLFVASLYPNAGALQNLKSFACVFWIGIGGGHDHALNPGRDDGLGAGRRSTVRGARLQCDVQCGAFGVEAVLLRIAQCFNLGVRQTRAAMPSAPDDLAAFNQHRADHGIGRRGAVTSSGQAKSKAH